MTYTTREHLLQNARESFEKNIPKVADGYQVLIYPYLTCPQQANLPIQRFVRGLGLNRVNADKINCGLTQALNERSTRYSRKDCTEYIVTDVNRFINDFISKL